MAEKHTPAPWVIIPARAYDGDDDTLEGSFISPAGIEGSDGSPVCVFADLSGNPTLFENECDYHLISAAPDLLAACKLLVAGDDVLKWTAGLSKARAAIAKAEGATNA